jgi:hypothetical protein
MKQLCTAVQNRGSEEKLLMMAKVVSPILEFAS